VPARPLNVGPLPPPLPRPFHAFVTAVPFERALRVQRGLQQPREFAAVRPLPLQVLDRAMMRLRKGVVRRPNPLAVH
jgi:hypothetical protein